MSATVFKKLESSLRAAIRIMPFVVLCCALLTADSNPAHALTPAGTAINNPIAGMTAAKAVGGAPLSATSTAPAPVTVLPVSGVQWLAQPSPATINANASGMLYYNFAHTGNIGILPTKDTFQITVSGAWLAGVYLDAAGTQPALGSVQLSPNANNTFGFYVKVSAPPNSEGASSTINVTVLNNYYQINGTNDGYGDPDRIASAINITVPAVSPNAIITSPTAGQSLSGIVTITGTASDANFQSYALYYGPGASPSTWGTITATSTTPVASGTLGTWDTSNLYGDYKLKLVALDTSGIITQTQLPVIVGNTISQISATLPAGQWTMVSMPGYPLNSDPRSFLGNSRYEVQKWDPAMPSNDPYLYKYKQTFSVTAGDGFWVKPYGAPITYSLNAWITDTTKDFEKRIESGWNQIGVPFNREIAWSMFQFRPDGQVNAVPISTAISNGWLDSSFYSYANGYQQKGIADTMQPYIGYFAMANVPGTLVISPGAGVPNWLAKVVRPVFEWRLQVAAATDNARDTDNFAGELRGASDAFSPEDSMEPPPVEPFISVYFPHEDWTSGAGRFAADIRAPQTSSDPEKVWTFIVKTSEPNKPVTITWPNAASLPNNYTILVRDDSTGQELDPKIRPSYDTTTDTEGKRTFSIVARRIGASQEISLGTNILPGWSLFSVPLEPVDTNAKLQLGSTFLNLKIFQYYNHELFATEQGGGQVDIQAGLGYWIHADNPSEVKFHGVPLTQSEQVDVPLTEGWNLIGNPFQFAIIFGDNITILRNAESMPLSEAVQRDWLDGNIYLYDGATSQYSKLAPGSSLQPWQAYAIKTHGACTLRLAK